MEELLALLSSPLDSDNEKAAALFNCRYSESDLEKLKEPFMENNTRVTSAIMIIMGDTTSRVQLLLLWFEEYFNKYRFDFDYGIEHDIRLHHRSAYMSNSLAKFVCIEKNFDSIITYLEFLNEKKQYSNFHAFWLLVLGLSIMRGRINNEQLEKLDTEKIINIEGPSGGPTSGIIKNFMQEYWWKQLSKREKKAVKENPNVSQNIYNYSFNNNLSKGKELNQEKNNPEETAAAQVTVLTDMYTENLKMGFLYGCDSEEYKKIEQKIAEYSRTITLQVSMALLGILGTAALRAMTELNLVFQKDKQRALEVINSIKQREEQRMLNHDKENVVTSQPNRVIHRYCVSISRAFQLEGKTMNVKAIFRCEIDLEKNSAKFRYHNTFGLENVSFHDLTCAPETTTIISAQREVVSSYIKQNRIALFGEGAGQKSIDNFFNWYDSIGYL